MPYQSLLRLVYSCTYALHRIEGVTCPSGLCHCEHLHLCASMSVLLAVVRGLPAVRLPGKHTNPFASQLCLWDR